MTIIFSTNEHNKSYLKQHGPDRKIDLRINKILLKQRISTFCAFFLLYAFWKIWGLQLPSPKWLTVQMKLLLSEVQKVETNTFLSFHKIRTSINNFLDLWGVSLFFEGHFLRYIPTDYVEFNLLINKWKKLICLNLNLWSMWSN